mgnify:CR=1 FL=1
MLLIPDELEPPVLPVFVLPPPLELLEFDELLELDELLLELLEFDDVLLLLELLEFDDVLLLLVFELDCEA